MAAAACSRCLSDEGEAIDARGQDRLDRGRHLRRLERPGQAMRTALAGERAVLDQRSHALLEEERVALGAFHEQALERLQRRVATQKARQQRLGALGRQRIEAELAVVGPRAPRMRVFRAVVDEEQDPRGGKALHEAVEQRLRLRVDPVKVLEDQQHGLGAALPEQHALDRVERALASLARIEPLPLRVLHRHVEQPEKRGQRGLESPIERQDLAGELLVHLAPSVPVVDPEVALEEIDHRQVGGGLAVGHRARLQHEPAVRPVGVGQFPEQARLADAGLAHGGDHLAVALAGALQGHAERLHLGVPPDEAREPPRARRPEDATGPRSLRSARTRRPGPRDPSRAPAPAG